MEISVALDGEKKRDLRFFAGDDMSLTIVVYEHDGDIDPITVTNVRFAVADGSLPMDTEFVVPSNFFGRVPYRIVGEVNDITTTLAYGIMQTEGGWPSLYCWCWSPNPYGIVGKAENITVADAGNYFDHPISVEEAIQELASRVNLDYNDPIAPAYLKTVSDLINGLEVDLFRFVPVAKQEGIYAQTDDSEHTAYVQDAADAIATYSRGSIFANAGRFNVNQITQPSMFKMRGAGARTLFKAYGTFANQVMFYSQNTLDLQLSDFQIEADRAQYPNLKCIFLAAPTRPMLQNIVMNKAGGYGVYTTDAADAAFDRVFVDEAQILGIYNIDAQRTRVSNSKTAHIYTQHGIHFKDGSDNEVINCVTSQTEQFGLNMYGSIRSRVLNHRSFDTKLEGINFLNTNYCTFENFQVFWTGDSAWASTDFGVSLYGDGVSGGVCNFNSIRGGYIANAAKSGIAMAEACQFNTVEGVTIMNPNGANEAQGSAVLFYGSGVQNNNVTGINAWADNGFMRHAVHEFNAGTGQPGLNKFSNINATGNTSTLVNKAASSSYVTTPSSGTLATLTGAETLTNKTLSGPSIAVTGAATSATVMATGAVQGASLAATGPGAGGTIAATGAITGASATMTGTVTGANVVATSLVSGNSVSASAGLSGATLTLSGAAGVGSVASSGAILSSSASAGIGYTTGAGGTVTQLTSKSTAVTLNRLCGNIVTHNASLASGATVSFTLNNSTIGANDFVYPERASGGTAMSYYVGIDSISAGSCVIYLTNTTAGALGEAVTLRFIVLKGAVS